jgi:lipoprotein NlpI
MKVVVPVILLLVGCAAPAWCGSYEDLNAGIAERNRQDWDGAIAYLSRALAANDLNADLQYVAHLDRGEAYAAKGQLDSAAADFAVCIAQRPDDITPLFFQARINLATGKPDAARQDVDAVMAADPYAAEEAYTMRAKAYEIEGDTENQLKDMQAVLAKDPKNISAYFDFGIAELLSGHADEAAAVFTKLTVEDNSQRSPHYWDYWLWLAITDLKQGKSVSQNLPSGFDHTKWPAPMIDFLQGHATQEAVYAAAKDDQRAAIGRLCDANFYLGEWHLIHGDGAEAKLLLNQAARDCPRNFLSWYAAEAESKNAP